jgi:hypothetical protein
MNTGQGRLRLVTGAAGGGLAIEKSSRGAAFGDYDNDGDVDVLIVNMDDRPTLLRNDSDEGHWITLRLVGVRSNRDGIGAKVTATAGGRRQVMMVHSGGSYLSHNDMRVHFGLGATATVDQITIRWPSGQVDTLDGLAADHFTSRGRVRGESRALSVPAPLSAKRAAVRRYLAFRDRDDLIRGDAGDRLHPADGPHLDPIGARRARPEMRARSF